jgi:predicted phosphohydrolase
MEKIFAIADLHLPFGKAKAMDKFGPQWANHSARIERAWRETVSEGDVVLIAGDTSWATKIEDAMRDLDFLDRLPGIKVLCKGNHDLWWPHTGKKLRKLKRRGLYFIQGYESVGRLAIAATRLCEFPFCQWPGAAGYAKEGETLRENEMNSEATRAREMDRLRGALSAMQNAQEGRTLGGRQGLNICMTHYPPFAADGLPTPLTAMMSEYGVDICVFAHIHGTFGAKIPGAERVIGKTRYVLTSSDQIGFAPLFLTDARVLVSASDYERLLQKYYDKGSLSNEEWEDYGDYSEYLLQNPLHDAISL